MPLQPTLSGYSLAWFRHPLPFQGAPFQWGLTGLLGQRAQSSIYRACVPSCQHPLSLVQCRQGFRISNCPLLAYGIEEGMDVSRSSFRDSLSQDNAGQISLCPPLPRIARICSCMGIHYSSSYRMSANPTSWFKIHQSLDLSGGVETELPAQLGDGAFRLDSEMQEELFAAFWSLLLWPRSRCLHHFIRYLMSTFSWPSFQGSQGRGGNGQDGGFHPSFAPKSRTYRKQ